MLDRPTRRPRAPKEGRAATLARARARRHRARAKAEAWVIPVQSLRRPRSAMRSRVPAAVGRRKQAEGSRGVGNRAARLGDLRLTPRPCGFGRLRPTLIVSRSGVLFKKPQRQLEPAAAAARSSARVGSDSVRFSR